MRLKLSNSFTIAISASLLALSLWAISPIAESQVGVLKENVALQGANPGFSQSGNANISGTMRAGQFVGGGAGLTGLSASSLVGTLPASSFPVPLVLSSGVQRPGIINVTYSYSNSFGTGAAIFGEATGAGGWVSGIHGDTKSPIGQGVYGTTSGSFGGAGVRGRSASSDGYGVYGEGGTGVFGTGDIGVEGITYDRDGFAIHGRTYDSLGTAARLEAPLTGTGLKIISQFGVVFNSSADLGVGYQAVMTGATSLRGYIANLGTATNSKGYVAVTNAADSIGFLAEALSGIGVKGNASSTTGIGVEGSHASVTGTGSGIFGQTNSTSGRGVLGMALAPTGANYGGRFESDSTSGRGVFGYTSSVDAAATPYAIRGQASTATLGYAVYAVGDSGASGVKSFRIDHPHDPLNKYLLHFASESPFPQNFYNGNVVTDKNGYAWVELPEYFEDINTNFKYQLTVVEDGETEDFVLVKVIQKIKGNRFRIRTSHPNVEVSWEVKADRNDDRIKFNRPTDVKDKPESERGMYQHPEYYNAGPEMGMDYSVQSTVHALKRSARK